MEDEGDIYESIEEIWPDFPTEEDYLWNEDEYQNKILKTKSQMRLFFCLILFRFKTNE